MKNHLLAALPADEFQRIEAGLEPVSFKLGEVLYESDDKLDCCYFPTTAIISMLFIMKTGAMGVIGVIGNDGISGYALFLGGGVIDRYGLEKAVCECYRTCLQLF